MSQKKVQAWANYTKILLDLHQKWAPHEGQKAVGKSVFRDGKRVTFVQCGRKWGKTELAIYFLYRWALTYPGSSCYYFAPFQKQAREILWANQRLQSFCREYVQEINKTEMRVTLKTGSFIKLDGSDNVDANRGTTPHLAIYDEFRDFRPEFHQAFGPNLAAKQAPLVIFGTPPDHECEYTEMAEICQKPGLKKYYSHFKMPSHTNPHIDREWLAKEKELLVSRGEADVWQREYMAEFVIGGANAIFPMFSKDKFVRWHEKIMHDLRRDLHKLQWFVTADPGSATVFAVLFGALNPYTKQWYILDEIYETRTSHTSVDQIWPRCEEIRKDLLPACPDWESQWTFTYDEAATWFATEVMDRFQVSFQPTQKASNKKEMGLSLIKDIMLNEKLVISERCKYLIWEVQRYIKDKHGRIPKEDDHLIDCWRYQNAAAYYELNETKEESVLEQDPEGRRGFSIEDDMPELFDDTFPGIDTGF